MPYLGFITEGVNNYWASEFWTNFKDASYHVLHPNLTVRGMYTFDRCGLVYKSFSLALSPLNLWFSFTYDLEFTEWLTVVKTAEHISLLLQRESDSFWARKLRQIISIQLILTPGFNWCHLVTQNYQPNIAQISRTPGYRRLP